MLKKRVIRAFKLLVLCLAFSYSYSNNQPNTKTKELTKTNLPDTNKINALLCLSEKYANNGLYDSALFFSNSALTLSKKTSFSNGVFNAELNIGVVNFYQSKFPEALDHFLKALKIAENHNDKKKTSVVLRKIGNVYNVQKDYLKAKSYYHQALKIDEELGDKIGISNNLTCIGGIYFIQRDFDQCLNYYLKALKLAESAGNIKLQGIILGNIGGAYYSQKNYDKTIEFAFKALKIAEQTTDRLQIAKILGNIGTVNRETRKFDLAINYLKKAIAIDDSIGALNDLRLFEESLSDVYNLQGEFKLALDHYKRASKIKDSIFSQENKKELVKKQMTFEFEKKNAEQRALQEKKDAISLKEKERQRVIIYSVSVVLVLLSLLTFFIFRGYKIKQHSNILVTQKKVEIENQKKIVEEKNKEITDSINYAKHIQQAKMPSKDTFFNNVPSGFILFKPKDIVSGDFYFFQKTKEQFFIAVADCTGHGVPGAFVSMIGSEKLEAAFLKSTDTSEILKILNNGIKAAFNQSNIKQAARDGMDIALCSLDIENGELKYAGANRPLWLIRKDQVELKEIKATKQSIGGFTEEDQIFNTHNLTLTKGDTFYVFTDGYSDQFGGTEGKKLMTKQLKRILIEIQHLSMQEQGVYLENFMADWRGNKEQVDDILIIGVRL